MAEATQEQVKQVWRLHMKLAADAPEDQAMALGVASICELALEALELRALVPTDEELDSVLDCGDVDGKRWLDRVRAWKGRAK